MRGVHAKARTFFNPAVADTCSHPKADLRGGREHSSGSQAAKGDKKACSTELK